MNEKRNTTTSDQLQPSFDFKAMHNGVQCIASMNPDDVGTERQFWFTSKMLCEVFDIARKTLEDNIQSLTNDGEIHGEIEVNFYHVRAWRLYEQFEWAHLSIDRPSLPLR